MTDIELHRGYSVVTIAYMAGIYWFSSFSGFGIGNHPMIQLGSNLFHIPLYAGLAFFFVLALAGGKAEGALLPGPYWITVLGAGAYGVLDELHQSFVPGRYPSLVDVLLDLIGIIGMLLLLRLRSRQEARS